MVRAAQLQSQQDQLSQIALELSNFTENGTTTLSQEGVLAGNATAMGLAQNGKDLEQKKQQANGILRYFVQDPNVLAAYKQNAEGLANNQKTVEDLLAKQNLTPDQKQKLEQIQTKIQQELKRSDSCKEVSLLPILSGCS